MENSQLKHVKYTHRYNINEGLLHLALVSIWNNQLVSLNTLVCLCYLIARIKFMITLTSTHLYTLFIRL